MVTLNHNVIQSSIDVSLSVRFSNLFLYQQDILQMVFCAAEPAAAAAALSIQTLVITELRDGYTWLREGGMNKRKVSADPTSSTWWSAAPSPLVPGKTGTLLYNSKAGPLAWIEDKRPVNLRSKPSK